MKEVNVLIDSLVKISDFVSIVESCNVKADLVKGTTCVDARSLIGVMNLVPREPMQFVIHEDDETAAVIIDKISKYIVA